jgi:hypothetical protein
MVKMAEKRRRKKQPGQIFVNASGGRRRLLALVALAVGCACLAYLLMLATALSGVLWQDAKAPPRTAERSTTGSAPAGGHGAGADSGGLRVASPLVASAPAGGAAW